MEKQRKELIDEFISTNSRINLSAIRDEAGIWTKHIQDSLEINKVITLRPKHTLCDVGTGGWFPLLPIAISNPELQCIGIDSTRKKVDAVNEMISHLKIANAKAIRTRAEDYNKKKSNEDIKIATDEAPGFDYVTARAVGYIDKLLPQIHHLVKKRGLLILYKQHTPEESQDIAYLSKKFHFVMQKKHKYTLFEGDIQRIIYVFKKS